MMLVCRRVLLLSSAVGVAVAFAPQPRTTRHISYLNEAKGDEDGPASFDVESSRRQLENMFSNANDEADASLNRGETGDSEEETTKLSFSKILSEYEKGVDFTLDSFPKPPPLSSIERDRRLGEIKLLECLAESDDAVSELWNHWYSERGSSAKSRLEKLGELITDPKDWLECEKGLIEMVDEYGIYFVEPVNLLATLYFLMGKLKVSYKLCEIILTLKPYHIGALSGIVQVSLGLNDVESTRKWAAKRMPRASTTDLEAIEDALQVDNPKRVDWVEKAVSVANDLLEQADQRTQEDFFGKPETYYDNVGEATSDSAPAVENTSDSNFSDEDIDDSAWQ